MPHARIGYGPFYYAFPRQGNNLVITAHDFSFLNSSFHPSTQIEKRFSEVSAVIQRCQAIVCTSDAMARECRRHFPQYAERVVRIYDGAEALRSPASRCHRLDLIGARPFILAVGTIEPRKNYDRLLDAYECLTALMGDQAPALVIVGRAGWMCESTVRRLTDLQDRGRVLWMQDASDDELADCYSRASIFSYLSAYEGFGYPPFEAAFFNVPMVLTQMSSVGEIWQGYAECVDPEDSASVASLWRKVLASSPEQKEAAVARQRYRAEQYGWKRCVSAYLELFGRLAASDAKSGEASN
jgi:alpha-1,3-rhamnosyl/mannosyltransferase